MKNTFVKLTLLAVAIVIAGCGRFASSDGEPAVTDTEFASAIGGSDLTLVKFGAPWCGPCQMLNQELAAMAGEINVMKINVDNNGALAERYNVSNLPHLVLFREGKPIDHKVGYMPASEIRAWAGNHRSVSPGEVQANPFAE